MQYFQTCCGYYRHIPQFVGRNVGTRTSGTSGQRSHIQGCLIGIIAETGSRRPDKNMNFPTF
jgi:hypothetical protein